VRTVARTAGPGRNGLVRKSLEEAGLGVCVTAVADLVRPLSEHVRIVRAVGIVAGKALLSGKGRMDMPGFFRILRSGMAGEAEFSVTGNEELFFFCSMRGMAGQTSRTGRYGGMTVGYLFPVVAMTAETQEIPFPGEQLRAFRCMGGMAGKAASVLERLMFDLALVTERGGVMAGQAEFAGILRGCKGVRRCGRIMAGLAPHCRHRGMDACLEELGL